MHMTDFFKTVGVGEQLKEQNTTVDKEENAVEKKQKTEEAKIEIQETFLDGFASDLSTSVYRAPKDLVQLVNADNVVGIKDVLSQLKSSELEIVKSNANDNIKELSQKRIRMVRDKCHIKINRLNLERKLELQIEEAEKVKDNTKVNELQNELKRRKNVRKSEEYTDVQQAMQEERMKHTLNKYSVYNQGNCGVIYTSNIYQDMNTSGSFININVGIKEQNIF